MLAGCASQQPSVIALDEPIQAQRLPKPPKPIRVEEVPNPLALRTQLKPLPETQRTKQAKEPIDERVRVARTNPEARVAPSQEDHINAIQTPAFPPPEEPATITTKLRLGPLPKAESRKPKI